MDQENDPDTLAMIGASAALEMSDIPFAGPIAAVRVGRIDGELVVNPTINEWEQCDINIIVAGSKTGVVMVEGGGDFVSEADMLEAIFFGHQAIQPVDRSSRIELKAASGIAQTGLHSAAAGRRAGRKDRTPLPRRPAGGRCDSRQNDAYSRCGEPRPARF